MNFPTWFRQEPGFQFYDADGDLCVYLGPGKKREDEIVGNVVIDGNQNACGSVVHLKWEFFDHLYACYYKGEWCIHAVRFGDSTEKWRLTR